MPQKNSQRIIARMIASLIVTVMIISAGTFAIWFQVRHSEQQSVISSAHYAINRIDLLLNEANGASMQARHYLNLPCSALVSSELNKLTIDQPHLRVISLLKRNKLICSSFGVSVQRTVDTRDYVQHRLMLRTGSMITPNITLLILLSSFPEGTVAVSISAPHITEILSLLSTYSQLGLQVGGQMMSTGGKVIPVHVSKNRFSIQSVNYPYHIVYTLPTKVPFNQLVKQGMMLLFLFIALGIGGGGLVWHLSFKTLTPYDHLARAIARKEIIPWYQPVVKSDTGEIHGVEVLARWRHSGISVPPDEFIPLAEKSGLIIPLTRQLIEQAIADLRPIIHRVHQPFHIAFNISAAHLQPDALITKDLSRFQTFFPADSIQLIAEITEREPFTQFPQINELLSTLHQQGIQIALDDFGTGYSNLGYLNTLPIDYIKIDRSFINRITEEDGSDKLVDCVISMARTLELGIVAEGVETAYQAKWLAAHNVEFLQGYFYSRPLSAAHFVRMAVLQRMSYSIPDENIII